MKNFFSLLILSVISASTNYGQNVTSAHLSGKLSMDDTWESEMYISYIPTFEDMYTMSNEMIIAKTGIDSLGYFKFDIDFLPEEEKLYRLHLIKKEDTPATLIIGGKDENHLFLILNRFSNILLNSNSSSPPFRNIDYTNSRENRTLQQITNIVFTADSIAAESSASKRILIDNRLQKDLLRIADTSDNFLISLYAIYKSNFESNYSSNQAFYVAYNKRWRNQKNAYYKTFSERLPTEKTDNGIIPIWAISALILGATGFFFRKRYLKKNRKFEKLSIQERKVYKFLQQGATNQEISSHLNISLSTVKSHVSSIYSKLKIKSRREILNNN